MQWRPPKVTTTHTTCRHSASAGAPKPGPKFAAIVESEGQAAGPPEFGTLLRSFRLTAGLSQEALAERAGLSSHGVSALEWGYRRTPRRGTLALLAGALSLSDEQVRELEKAAARWVLLRDGVKASVLVAPWPDTPTTNLPLSLASFVGREAEVDEIAALAREHRLVTLTGTAGVGKTQTALQVATAICDSSAAWFVGLAPISDPSLLPAAIASALHVQEVPNRPLLETLLAHLKNRTLLLILDNCEHVATEAAKVADALLAGCPRVGILATSREPLLASGEWTYRLPSLSTPSREAAARLCATDATAYGAVLLFSDRARAVDHRFALSDDNAPAVAELCRRLDGIPLAIELAAARANSLSITALLERLEDRFRILAGGLRTALPRQQTMRAAIDWSYDSLSAPEKRLFERLSIFAGGCTLVSAESVCTGEDVATADVFDLISSLVDKSMVVDFGGIEPRYRLLESFRQYGREKLAARGETEIVAHRHARTFLELAEQLERSYDSESEGLLRDRTEQELDNWRAALEWSLGARGDVALGRRLAGELYPAWPFFAHLEGQRWVSSAIECIDERTPLEVIAKLSYTQTIIASELGEFEVELTSSQIALERYVALGDDLGIARSQYQAGTALLRHGRLAQAEPLLREALAGARALGTRRLLAQVLRQVSTVHQMNGDLAEARAPAAEALAIYEALGCERDRAKMVAFALAALEFHAGNAELALTHASEGLAAFRAINYTQSNARLLCNMSIICSYLSRYHEAAGHAREALDLPSEQQSADSVVRALHAIGTVTVLWPRGSSMHRPEACARAARLLGFVEAKHPGQKILSSVEQRLYDQTFGALRDALGADAVADLMAEGALMTQERAVAEAAEV
jgi:predicted ATPase/transcriptional regulator with XRE-family HTH domain